MFPKYRFQGPNGPADAPRPSDTQLVELYAMPDSPERRSKAAEYALMGAVMDYPIDACGWPYESTMASRRAYGYTWVPTMYMPSVPGAPNMPNVPGYNPKHAPVGAILVPPEGGWPA